MDNPDEHALVVKAFALAIGQRGFVTGYVEWCSDRAAANARGKLADLDGLTPEEVRIMTIEFVRNGGRPEQVVETRKERSHFRYYYKVILPLEGSPHRVFVELRLVDEDPDDPAVHIVSAHRQGV